jgi:uncharacterized membrane protein (DUF2068 family)
MARPVGVTILAIISFLGAVFIVLSGALVLLGRNATNLPELTAALILLTIIFGGLYALAGWGLWRLKNWGRILTISLVAIASGFELLRWYLTPHFEMSNFVATVVSLMLYGITVLYLFKPDIKPRFQRIGQNRT